MVEMGRRRDLELVEEIVNYLKKKKGVVTQGQLSSAVRINSDTAEKWLNILYFVLNECPRFKFGKTGRYGVVSIFEGDDIARIRTFDEMRQRVGEPGSLKSELTSKFDKEKMGLVSGEPSDVNHQTTPASSIQEGEDKSMKFAKLDSSFHRNLREELAERTASRQNSLDASARNHQNIIVISEKVKAVLRCTECGTENHFPMHCGEQMDFKETEFVCTFKGECGEKIPLPRHCEKPMGEDIGDTPEEQEFGCCLDDVLYNCSDWGEGMQLKSTDCTETGAECAYDSEKDIMGCIGGDTDTGGDVVDCDSEPASCDDIGGTTEEQEYGCCIGDMVYVCWEGEFFPYDCSDEGLTCGYDAMKDAMGCI